MSSGKLSLSSFAGMVSAPGLLERNPASCLDAVNWEFPAPGVVRKRRGFARQTGNTGGPVWSMLTSRLRGQNLLVSIGSSTLATAVRYGDGSGAFTALATVDGGTLTRDPVIGVYADGLRMHTAVCQQDHYLTADEGVARLESLATDIRYAGMPRGQGTTPTGVGLVVATANPLADGYARAYRVTWHRKDANGTEMGGAPTARFVVSNRSYFPGYVPATPMASYILIAIPWEFGTVGTALTTEYYWRLWGTHTYAEATQLGNDEMYLVAEAALTAGQIAAGTVLYYDDTPDEYLLSSPRLHTNLFNFPPGEAGLLQGVANADEPPPVANDVAYWQDVMWFSDYAFRPRLTVALIANFADGDTVSVTTLPGSTLTLTAKTVPVAATDFPIFTTGPTTGINIRETVREMVSIFNQEGLAISFGVAGFLVGTSSTQPGLLYFEASRSSANVAMSFNSSAPTKFQTLDGYVLGEDAPDGEATNGLCFSKPLRADAVPPVNRFTAGPANSRILRIFPFRDRLLVFTDVGIYQVTGRTFADFAVNPFDLGYRLIGREMVVECDQRVYAWCAEGIVEIDDGGVTVVSTPIEPTIEAAMVAVSSAPGTDLLSAGRAVFGVLGFGVAYRNQHQVRFHFPTVTNVAAMFGASDWLAFDTRTRAWARGRFTSKLINGYLDARSCGVVRFADDLLCMGCWSAGADTFIFTERRAYLATDFTEDSRDGSSNPVESTARFQYQVPDVEGAQHWQQTVFNWDAEEISWRTLPTSIEVTHVTEEGSGVQTIAVSELATRVEPSNDARRGQRLYVQLGHFLAQYAGFVGVSQAYRSGSRFARKVTP